MDEHDDMPCLKALAEAEGTSVRELIEEAVGFYARLPAAARRSLRAMASLAEDQAVGAAADAAGRGIIQFGLDLARKHGRRAAGRAYQDGQLPSEKAVEAEAIRLAREASA